MEEKKILPQKSKKENLITTDHQKQDSSKINKNIYFNSKIRNSSQNFRKNKTSFTKNNKKDSKNIISNKKCPESPNNLSSNKKVNNQKNTLSDSPEDIVTSFERKPSDLKSPDTISEDSFTSSSGENKLNDDEKKTDSKKNEKNNENNQKNKSNVFSGNELIYVDKIQDDDEDNNNNEIDNKQKITTGYIINNNSNNNSNKNNKILVSQKNDSKFILKKTSSDQIPYVPVNQRKILENKMNTEKSLTASNNNINTNINTDYKQHQKQFILKKKLHLNSEGSKSNKGMFTTQNNTKKGFAPLKENEIQKKKLFTSHNTILLMNKNQMNTVKYNRYNSDNKLEIDDEKYLKNYKNEVNNSNENDKTNSNTNNTISNGGNTNDVISNHKKNNSKNELFNDKPKINENLKQKKNCVLFTKSVNNKLSLNTDNILKKKQSSYIKTSKSPTGKGSKIIYAPKKLGVIRVSSRKKSNHPIYNNMSYDPNKNLNDKIKNALSISTMNNNNGYINTTFDQNRFFEMNNSFYFGFDKNNVFNNNIQSLELNSVNGLNNSFDNGNNFLNGKLYNYNGNGIKTCNNNSQTNIFDDTKRYSLNNYYDRQTAKPLIHHNSSFDFNTIEQFHNFQNQSQLINLIGNNFLNNNAISNSINKTNTFINPDNNNVLNAFSNNDNNLNYSSVSLLNFQDLIILQEYLKQLIISLSKSKSIENECFELWNYYYNSSICGQLEKLFMNSFESNEIKISINYFLMSIMTCYDYSFELNLLNNTYITLGEILQLNYKNLMAICEHILNKTTNESITNIWVMKLAVIVKTSLFGDYNQYIMNNGYTMSIVERVSFNTNIIIQKLRFLLKNYKTNKNEKLTKIFKKIRESSYDEINNFFRDYILRICNINGSILASVYLRKNSNFRTLPAPYVRTKNNKPYSLVLDLDETLIHFKPKQNGEDGGILRIRPGINEFLDEVGKYYELIIFTTATQDYADALIDAVEEDKIYFDHRLYREHAIIMDNDFVKDLTRIGRPIDKMLIVDNMPQNFRLQKENGIIIRAFWGEDSYDNALNALIPILVNIAKEGGDIRKGLVKYRDEIVKNVTSNISKQNI